MSEDTVIEIDPKTGERFGYLYSYTDPNIRHKKKLDIQAVLEHLLNEQLLLKAGIIKPGKCRILTLASDAQNNKMHSLKSYKQDKYVHTQEDTQCGVACDSQPTQMSCSLTVRSESDHKISLSIKGTNEVTIPKSKKTRKLESVRNERLCDRNSNCNAESLNYRMETEYSTIPVDISLKKNSKNLKESESTNTLAAGESSASSSTNDFEDFLQRVAKVPKCCYGDGYTVQKEIANTSNLPVIKEIRKSLEQICESVATISSKFSASNSNKENLCSDESLNITPSCPINASMLIMDRINTCLQKQYKMSTKTAKPWENTSKKTVRKPSLTWSEQNAEIIAKTESRTSNVCDEEDISNDINRLNLSCACHYVTFCPSRNRLKVRSQRSSKNLGPSKASGGTMELLTMMKHLQNLMCLLSKQKHEESDQTLDFDNKDALVKLLSLTKSTMSVMKKYIDYMQNSNC